MSLLGSCQGGGRAGMCELVKLKEEFDDWVGKPSSFLCGLRHQWCTKKNARIVQGVERVVGRVS